MEYRLSLTPRLLAVGLCAVMALLVLLFALGFQVGQNMAVPAPLSASPSSLSPLSAQSSLPPLASAMPATAAAAPTAETAPAADGNPARYVRPTGEAP